MENSQQSQQNNQQENNSQNGDNQNQSQLGNSQVKKVPRKKLQVGEKDLEKNKKKGVEVELALQNKLIKLQYLIKQIQNELPILIEEAQEATKHANELRDNMLGTTSHDKDDLVQRIKDITVNFYEPGIENQKEINEDLQKQLDELSLDEFKQIKEDTENVKNRCIVKEQESGIEDIYTDLVNNIVNF